MWGGLDEQKYDFDNLSDFKISMWSWIAKKKLLHRKSSNVSLLSMHKTKYNIEDEIFDRAFNLDFER